jgi:putative FmdB family regulatory protein
MPLYEYECRRCDACFEELVSARDASVRCPRCGDGDVAKVLSNFAVGGAASPAAEPGPCGACGAAVRGSCASD